MAEPNDDGFTPEPVPDNIADMELTPSTANEPDGEQQQPEETTTEPNEPEGEEPETPPSEPSAEETEEQEPPAQPDQPPKETDEQAQKRYNDEQAKARIEQRKQRDYVNDRRQKLNDYEQKLDKSDTEARMAALEERETIRTNEQNQNTLINDAERAQRDIDLFNPAKPTFNQALYERALQRFSDSYVVTDQETGAVLGAYDRQGNTVSLHQYLKDEAETLSGVLGNQVQTAQRSAAQAEAKMRAKVMTPASKGKVVSSGDELQDFLDKHGDVSLL